MEWSRRRFVGIRPTSPYTSYVEVDGRDANGTTWTQQTPLVVVARQLFGNMVLTSDPEPVQPTTGTSCPYSQQLELFETNGHAVQLTNFYENGNDLSTSIQSYFGTMRLAPYGLAFAQICFPSAPGTSVNWEVDGTDDVGTSIAGTFTSTYTGTVKNVPSLGVSPTTVSLNVPSASQSATATVGLTLPSTQPWSIYTYPANKTTNWLTVSTVVPATATRRSRFRRTERVSRPVSTLPRSWSQLRIRQGE